MKKVAFLGPPSSYTHQAAVKAFGNEEPSFEACSSIQDVFIAVQSSNVSCGVAPFENSSNGPVLQTLDCLLDRSDECPDVYVYGEVYIDVRHCLLGHRQQPSWAGDPTESLPSTLKTRTGEDEAIHNGPDTEFHGITDVYSHSQALGQCQNFLTKCLPKATQYETSSTSGAAQTVAQKDLPTSAAIASKLAAEMYGLAILAENIQDASENTTRFILLRRRSVPDPCLPMEKVLSWKALVVFNISHEAPGALAKALLVFKNSDLNLTNLSNRPSRLRPWHYTFVVECEYIGVQSTGERRIRDLLDGLQGATESRKCMGFWSAQSAVGDR